MIDEKKYEGHTKGKWRIRENYDSTKCSIEAEDFLHTRTIAKGINPKRPADNALIADAPLLLAEVKRLREENEMLRRLGLGRDGIEVIE